MKAFVYSLLTCLMAFIVPFIALAQETTLKELVVTASRTEEDIKDTPASVQVITRQDLESKGVSKLNDVLRLATGVYQYTGLTRDNSAVSIRGFDNKQTLILIDGKRLAGEPTGVFEIDRITVEDIERIEIVRGPVSALYGSDALGGVINIITRRSDKPFIQFNSQYGTYNGGEGSKKVLSGIVSSGYVSNFNVQLSGMYLKQKPLIVNNDSTLDDDDLRKISMKASYRFSPSTALQFDASYMKELVKLQTETMGQTNKSRYDNYRYDLALQLTHKDKDIDILGRLYTSVYSKDYEQRNLKTGVLTDFYPTERKTPTAEIKATREFFGNHVVTIGAEYRQDIYKGAKIVTGEGSYIETREGLKKEGSEKNISYWAIYLQDEWFITNNLLAVPAIRYDDSSIFSGEISPKIGLTYRIMPNLRLKASVGHAFRSPNVEELYQYFTTRMARFWNSVRGNPDLKPEKSMSYEIALEAEGDKMRGRIALFYNDVKDLIQNILVGGTGTQANPQVFISSNIHKARIQGIEFEGGIELLKDLDLRLAYTYLDAMNKTTDLPLTLKPQHKLIGKLSYEHRPWGMRLDFWTEYVGRLIMGNQEKKSYNLYHINLTKNILKELTLYAGIDNIFDKKDSAIPLNGAFYYAGLRFKL